MELLRVIIFEGLTKVCSGNGRVDYLCMELNGRTTALINEPSGLRNVGQVKSAETDTRRDRADLRFADVNGTPHTFLIPASTELTY